MEDSKPQTTIANLQEAFKQLVRYPHAYSLAGPIYGKIPVTDRRERLDLGEPISYIDFPVSYNWNIQDKELQLSAESLSAINIVDRYVALYYLERDVSYKTFASKDEAIAYLKGNDEADVFLPVFVFDAYKDQEVWRDTFRSVGRITDEQMEDLVLYVRLTMDII